MLTLQLPLYPVAAIMALIYMSEKFWKKLKLGVDN
jgi:hypothetical protein